MKIKTSELIGPALDWAVAKCEGWSLVSGRVSYGDLMCKTGGAVRSLNTLPFSTDWSQGGPIIERERIGFQWQDSLGLFCAWKNTQIEWATWPDDCAYEEGPTPLIAAMRCYVASKLGEEVYVPEVLVG